MDNNFLTRSLAEESDKIDMAIQMSNQDISSWQEVTPVKLRAKDRVKDTPKLPYRRKLYTTTPQPVVRKSKEIKKPKRNCPSFSMNRTSCICMSYNKQSSLLCRSPNCFYRKILDRTRPNTPCNILATGRGGLARYNKTSNVYHHQGSLVDRNQKKVFLQNSILGVLRDHQSSYTYKRKDQNSNRIMPDEGDLLIVSKGFV